MIKSNAYRLNIYILLQLRWVDWYLKRT